MPILQIKQCSAPDASTVGNIMSNFTTAYTHGSSHQTFTVGTQIQNSNVVQATSEIETDSPQTHVTNSGTSTYHIDLLSEAFGVEGPVTANFTEYVQIWFPSSQVKPAFQKQVEDDFRRFDRLFKTESKGDVGLAVGWGIEDHAHENIKDEKAKCFFVLRGWQNMELFEKSLENDSYRQAIPILLAWNAPSKMWHVENKIRSSFKQK